MDGAQILWIQFYWVLLRAFLQFKICSQTESALVRRLQKVDLQVFSSSDCAKLHSKKVHFTNICGGVPGGYKSQCLGTFRYVQMNLFSRSFDLTFLLQVIRVIWQSALYFSADILHWIAIDITGGPLLVNGVQVGIVSWSVKPCGVPPYPGVFTEVSHYIDWIEQKTAIDLRLNIFVQSPSSAGN